MPPTTTEPASTEPAASELATTEPVASELATTEPAASEPSDENRSRPAAASVSDPLLELLRSQGDSLRALLEVLHERREAAGTASQGLDQDCMATFTALAQHLDQVRELAPRCAEPGVAADLERHVADARRLLGTIEVAVGMTNEGRASVEFTAENWLPELSGRERSVMERLLMGQSCVEIGNALGVSDTTIRTYRSRAMRKLRVTNFVELVKLAIRRGMITV